MAFNFSIQEIIIYLLNEFEKARDDQQHMSNRERWAEKNIHIFQTNQIISSGQVSSVLSPELNSKKRY